MSRSRLSFDVLKSSDFRLLLFTRMFSLSALQAQGVLIGWQIYELTKDPLMLGLSGLAEAVPAIACALFAGHVVDNSRPQRVYLACLGALALNTLFLFMIGSGIVPLATHHFLPLAYTAIFFSGIARSFIMPSSFSLMAQIVPRHDIPAASAWLSAGFQAALIIAPTLAGVIYGAKGAMTAWLVPLVMMSAAFAFMGFIKPAPYEKPSQQREPALKSIREGWRFILKTPVLLAAMALDMLAVLFGGAIALLPAFATDILQVGSEGLGLLRGAPAAGTVIMALLLAIFPMKTIKITHLLWVVAGFGVSMVCFGLSHVLWLSLLFLALSGMFDSVSIVIRQSLMQLLTPDHMRGRVSSVNSMFIISSNELGAFESGMLARLVGVVPSVVIGGMTTVLVAFGTALFSPGLLRTVIHSDSTPDSGKPPSAKNL